MSSSPAPATSRRARLRYRFDLTLSRGSGALILWLALVTTGFVVATGAVLHLVARWAGVEDDATSMVESFWDSLMRTLDPGTVTGDETWPYRLWALVITIIGIFIFSALIGLISSLIDRRIEELRKGRGLVVEEGHTLILGWSEKAHAIISEVMVANENQHGSSIVVLADRDRVELEDRINAHFGSSLALELVSGRVAMGALRSVLRGRRSGTRIVCRTGDPADPGDLAIVAPTAASSVIVLVDEQSGSPDAQATKVLLSLLSFGELRSNVVVELVDPRNAEPLVAASGGRVHTVVSTDLIARITAQVCRQAGMGSVFQELLDFDGDEIYFTSDPRLVGACYGQALVGYESSSPIGVRRADGSVQLNPPMDRRLEVGDQLIAISEDDDTLELGTLEEWRPSSDGDRAADHVAPDHLLLVGWNDTAPRILHHLALAAAPGSTVDIAYDPAFASIDASQLEVGSEVEVRAVAADGSQVDELAALLSARTYERIVLLGYRDSMAAAEADARTLLTLVHARRITAEPGHRNAGTSIVAELLEQRSVELGRIANPDDFVVSERLTSLLLAQLSENGDLDEVFSELLDGVGTEIVRLPVSPFVPDGATGELPWREVVRAARERGETAIGFSVPPTGSSDGVRVNPAKSEPMPLASTTGVIVLRCRRGVGGPVPERGTPRSGRGVP